MDAKSSNVSLVKDKWDKTNTSEKDLNLNKNGLEMVLLHHKEILIYWSETREQTEIPDEFCG